MNRRSGVVKSKAAEEGQDQSMSRWLLVPWPVRVLCVLMIASALVVVVATHGPVVPRVLFLGIFLGWVVLLLRGIRWIWVVTMVLFALGLLAQVLSGNVKWIGIILIIVDFILLIHPLTRQFYEHGDANADTSLDR
jgi:hypothetical protein